MLQMASEWQEWLRLPDRAAECWPDESWLPDCSPLCAKVGTVESLSVVHLALVRSPAAHLFNIFYPTNPEDYLIGHSCFFGSSVEVV